MEATADSDASTQVLAPDEATTGVSDPRAVLGGASRGDRTSVSKVADRPQDTTDTEKQDALDWFLADEGEDADPVYTVEINVSTDLRNPKIVQWQFKPMGSQRIDTLRRMFQLPINREQRRAGVTAELDGARFNAALVFESTVNPNLMEVLKTKGFADGAQLVMHRFRNKPLLVDQLAGQILTLSGGDEDDLRTAKEVIAAGN